MGTEERIICRLCLEMCNKFKALNEDTKGILEIVVPKINLDVVRRPVMCTSCAEMLKKCFDFKATCIYTQDYLVPFVNNEDVQVDLMNVYLRKDGNGTDVLEDQDICGLCLCPVKHCSAIALDVGEGVIVLKEMIEQCLSELDLSVIKKPVICPPCHYSLKVSFRFVTDCLLVEEKIKKCCEILNMDSKDQIELSTLLEFATSEVIVINGEELCLNRKNPGEISKKGDVFKLKQMSFGDREYAKGDIVNKNDSFKEFVGQKVNDEQQFTPTDMWACEEERNQIGSAKMKGIFCGGSKTKNSKENHVEMKDRQFLDNEEIEIKTDNSDFLRTANDIVLPQSEVSTRLQGREKWYMPYLTRESRVTPCLSEPCIEPFRSEVKMYKCNSCSFQSKLEWNFNRHLLVHKDPSEVTMYKCSFCSFKTKHKRNLKNHELIHKDPSEITMYKCASCSFQTKYKRSLKYHEVTHKHTSAYKCNVCSFRAKNTPSLKYHELTHTDPSKVTVYNCDSCLFQTKYKQSLKKHSFKHMNP